MERGMFNQQRLQTGWLLAGDWLALTLFVFLGQLDHGMLSASAWPRLITTTLELVLPWTIVAALMGAYRLAPELGKRAFLSRSLIAWLVAAPLALLLRAWLHGQATIIVIFFAITLGLGGAFLLGWRVIFINLLSPRLAKAPAA